MGIGKVLSKIFNKARAKKITGIVKPRFADTVSDRIISAGWLLSEMDIAGGDRAYQYVGGICVTVGLAGTEFTSPVYIGDNVTIYTEIIKQGRSSVDIKVEAHAESRVGGEVRKVAEGVFSFVHIDKNGKSKEITKHKPFGSSAKKQRPKASATDVLTEEPELKPGQELSYRTAARPKDKNYNGDIFGGWILDKMDEAGGLRARRFTKQVMVPRAIDDMTFHRPVSELDEVSIYTEIEKVGTTSVRIKVEAWSLRNDLEKYEKVTEGTFTYVAVDKDKKPVPIQPKP